MRDMNESEKARVSPLIIIAIILGIVGIVFMFQHSAGADGVDAYNRIISNIRGATFIICSCMFAVCKIIISRKK